MCLTHVARKESHTGLLEHPKWQRLTEMWKPPPTSPSCILPFLLLSYFSSPILSSCIVLSNGQGARSLSLSSSYQKLPTVARWLPTLLWPDHSSFPSFFRYPSPIATITPVTPSWPTKTVNPQLTHSCESATVWSVVTFVLCFNSFSRV